EKRYAAWKQPVGLHDYERPNSRLGGVVYEIPLTIVIAGYVAADAQGAHVVNEYWSSVIRRKASGEEVIIGDMMSGQYLDDLRSSEPLGRRGYACLQAVHQLGETPVSILGGLFTFFPYLLLEEGDWVLSQDGHFGKVTEDWFFNGNGNAPYWFTGGWPFITSTGSALWFSDTHPQREADDCAVRILVPGLESDTAGCVVICLDGLEGNAHCGIKI